jgi:hypothetical protein
MFGRQSQPRAEMLLCWELAHVRPTLQDHRLRQRDPEPIHQADVHPAHSLQVPENFLGVVARILAM